MRSEIRQLNAMADPGLGEAVARRKILSGRASQWGQGKGRKRYLGTRGLRPKEQGDQLGERKRGGSPAGRQENRPNSNRPYFCLGFLPRV